jgi:DNA polymerase III epsilon subunit-like protein
MPDSQTLPEPASARSIDWPSCRYVAIDVEGTASPAGQLEGLVELAAVEIWLNGTLGRRLHSLLNPGMPITAIGTRIHGLRDRDVAGQPRLDTLRPRLAELIDGAVVVAHNARVDWGLLQRDCPGLRPLGALDTLRMSRSLWPGQRQHGLDAVLDRLGIRVDLAQGAERSGRHTALHDAMATAQALVRMVEVAREESVDVAGLLRSSLLPEDQPSSNGRSQTDLFEGGGG